tara:strand:+ start:8357 stop:8620 length:264 start_codon:yes stop_codon:yes gene_type:complete
MMNNEEKNVEQARDLELFTIRGILKSEQGRHFLWRCLENCYTFDNIFEADHNKHIYKSGSRRHGLWLDSEIREADSDLYYKMLKENR